VYLVTAEGVDAAAEALSAHDRVLVQLHVPALVRKPLLGCRQGLERMTAHFNEQRQTSNCRQYIWCNEGWVATSSMSLTDGVRTCAWVQVPCAARASSHPLMAFTVPVSLYTLEGALSTEHARNSDESRQGPTFFEHFCFILSAGLASWKAHMDTVLRQAPPGVWGDLMLTIAHQTGGSMGVRL